MNISKFIESLSEIEKIELEKYFLSKEQARISVNEFLTMFKSSISVRAYNCLHAYGNNTIKYYPSIKYMDEFSPKEFVKMRNAGRKSLYEITDILNENNYKYKDK